MLKPEFIYEPPPWNRFLRDMRTKHIRERDDKTAYGLVPLLDTPEDIATVMKWESNEKLMRTLVINGKLSESGEDALLYHIRALMDENRVMFGMVNNHGYLFGQVGIARINRSIGTGKLFVLNGEEQYHRQHRSTNAVYMLCYLAYLYDFSQLTAEVLTDNTPSNALFTHLATRKRKQRDNVYVYTIDLQDLEYPEDFQPVVW